MQEILSKILIKQVYGPVLIIIFALIISKIVVRAITKVFMHRNRKLRVSDKRYNTLVKLMCNAAKYFIYAIAIIMILGIFGINTVSIITSLGVVGVVAGLALQDLLKDLISGLSIVIEEQFSLGDIVTIGGFKGEVVSMGLKTTKIKSYTGEEKIMANHLITEVINHSINNSLAIIDVSVSYDTDLDKLENILNKLCAKMTKSIENLSGDIVVCGLQKLDSSSVVYRVTAPTIAEQQYGVERIIRKMIKEELDKNNIEIPYNQVVVHNG